MRRLIIAAMLLGACDSSSSTPHAFTISRDIASSGEELESALFQSVGATLAPGHSITRLDNGAMIDALVADVQKATRSIDVAMYIWEKGQASDRLVSAMADRARAGVACRLVIDAFGSKKFEQDIAPALTAAGCKVLMFRPVTPGTVALRNHRKIFVIDGLVAYTGGHCIRDEWLGDGITNEAWRDTSARLTGPAVRDALQAIAENWQEAGGELLPGRAFRAQPTDGTARVAWVSSTASPSVSRAERLTLLLLAAAHTRLWISSAYFVPSDDVLSMLERKARAGADVRILVPDEHNDSKAALVGQRKLYKRLAEAGIRIWEYQPSMMHAKTMVVDDVLSVVGSINLDPLSFNKLEEAAFVVEDATFTAGMATKFLEDLSHATLSAGPPLRPSPAR